MSFSLQVYGRTWGNGEGCYAYEVNPAVAVDLEGIIKAGGEPNVGKHASDFACVYDWRLIERTTHYAINRPSRLVTETVTTLRERCIRGFRKGMSPARFDRITNR